MSDEVATDAVAAEGVGVTVRVTEASSLHNLRAALDRAGDGRNRVKLVVEIDDREVEVALRRGYAVSPSDRRTIEALPGITTVLQA